MFERFTERARRVLVESQSFARELGSDFIDTEHMLVGVMRTGDTLAAELVHASGVTEQLVLESIIRIRGRHDPTPTADPPFTEQAKKSMEYALREALQQGKSYIGPEHLLLGLMRAEQSRANDILNDNGLSLNRARELVTNPSPRTKASAQDDIGSSLKEELAEIDEDDEKVEQLFDELDDSPRSEKEQVSRYEIQLRLFVDNPQLPQPVYPIKLDRATEFDDARQRAAALSVEPILQRIERFITSESIEPESLAQLESDRSILAYCLRAPNIDPITVSRAIARVIQILGPDSRNRGAIIETAAEAGFEDPEAVADSVIGAMTAVANFGSEDSVSAGSALTDATEAISHLSAAVESKMTADEVSTWREAVREGRDRLLSEGLPDSLAQWFSPKGFAIGTGSLVGSIAFLYPLLNSIAHLINSLAK